MKALRLIEGQKLFTSRDGVTSRKIWTSVLRTIWCERKYSYKYSYSGH